MNRGKTTSRFTRTLDRLERAIPGPLKGTWIALRSPGAALMRLPIAILLILGGIFSFLPVLGLWMLPIGLLLLAVDVPILRGPLSTSIIRLRRWWRRVMPKRR